MNIAPEEQSLAEFQSLKFGKAETKYILYLIKDEKIVHVP